MKTINVGNTIIRLAEPTGFCYGVNAALEAVESAVKEHSQKLEPGLYTYGPIIHNRVTIDELLSKGVKIADDIDNIPSGSTIIIRTHGISAEVEQKIRGSSLTVRDATCPHVKKIHKIVEEAARVGKIIIIIGDPNHPEVIGTRGRGGEAVFIMQKSEDFSDIEQEISAMYRLHNYKDADLQTANQILVVAQTTISQQMWNECINVVKKAFPHADIKRTICESTEKRQQACSETAELSDVMIVIGDRNSSNSVKLYEISKEKCEHTIFIEQFEDLPLKQLLKYNRIGVSASASTPARIIKEVISAMSEEITNNNEEMNEMQDYMEEIERSLRLPGRGEIVTGDIILVNDREVVVNLGCKKDGIIPKDEIVLKPDQDLKSQFHEGESVQAKVIKTDDGDGNILLSRKKLEVNEHWDEIIAALDNKSFVDVKVIREVKGGVIAAYKEVSGFIPMSQLSDRYTEKADEFIGQVLPVRVTRVDQKRNKAVFSHKSYLAEQKAKKIAEIWETLNVGDVLEGTVMRFTDYGAFVDIGGIDGLLHISEISWGKLKHPQEVLQIGQKVNVKILSMSSDNGKISLGLKQNTPEPWSVINEKYVVGQVVEGKVVQIKEYGAFVELEPGLDGLVHISEIAFKRVTNISDEISVGQQIKAKILEIDEDKRRISLSIKDTLDPDAVDEEPAEAAPEVEAVEAAPAEAEAEAVEAAPEEVAEPEEEAADQE